MASTKWDEIEAGWQMEKTARKRLLRNLPFFVVLVCLLWSAAWRVSQHREHERMVAEAWKRDQGELRRDYSRLVSAAEQKDDVAYTLLGPLVFERTLELETERSELSRSDREKIASFDIGKIQRCIAPRLSGFNAMSEQEKASCQKTVDEGK